MNSRILLNVIFVYGTPVALIIGLVVMIRGGPRSLARHPRVMDVACGSCRYLLRGIESETCPECGRALRQVGILTPQMPGQHKRPLATWIAAIGIGLAALLVFAFVTVIASAFGEASSEYRFGIGWMEMLFGLAASLLMVFASISLIRFRESERLVERRCAAEMYLTEKHRAAHSGSPEGV